MKRSIVAVLSVLALLTTVSASALPGLSAAGLVPVMCAEGDATADGRVFPEPSVSPTFLTLADLACGVELLEARHEDLIEVTTIGTSAGGHPIHDIVLTDESIPVGEKRHLLILSSIHGNEHAGREGAARVIEDMVEGFADADLVERTLSRFVVHFVMANPDGWAAGDPTAEGGGVNFVRPNDGGRDLNRNFPVSGFLRAANGTLDQPEGRAIDGLLQRYADTDHDPEDPEYRGWYLGTDNHGQGVKPVAASGLQIVGQFHYAKSERLARFADSISTFMEGTALESIEALNQATGGAVQPYEWGTLYDILGYSASGSGIDYYNTPGLIDGTGFATEMTASNLPFSNILTHPGLVNQMWVDTVRAINYAMFSTAVHPEEDVFPIPGRTAYVLDEDRTTSTDLDGFGPTWGTAFDPEDPDVPGNFTGDEAEPGFAYRHYDVSRMDFFTDLSRFGSRDLAPVTVEGVLDGSVDMGAFDSLILADRVQPGGAATPDAAWVAALGAYVEGGGSLILTDGAAPLLTELVDGIAAEDVSSVARDVGYVDFLDDEVLTADLRGVASQTYDVIPIGYPDNADAAPNWTVDQGAWEAAGGITAGTNGAGQTIYGALPMGEGEVLFLGALLPEPTEAFFHPYGLQSYAVTYTGYTLLANMLAYADPQPDPDPEPDPDPDLTPTPTPSPTPSPTTPPGGSPSPSPSPSPSAGPSPSPEPGPGPAAGATVTRLAGDDRIGTALAISRDLVEADAAGAVVLARADDFPDALAGGVLADAVDGPLLLTPTDALPAAVLAEIDRVLPVGGRVEVLGGTAAISGDVEEALVDVGYAVRRLAGGDRFETAALVAQASVQLGADGRRHLATGADFPDALAAGAAAAHAGGVLLLTDGDRMPAATEQAMADLGDRPAVAIGGPAAAAAPDATSVVGADRIDTAVLVAERMGAVTAVGIATGADFPDALAGVAHIATQDGPILLAARDTLPERVAAYLQARSSTIEEAHLYGGTAVLSMAVEEAVARTLG